VLADTSSYPYCALFDMLPQIYPAESENALSNSSGKQTSFDLLHISHRLIQL
jgi:hypothetical protein